MNVYRVNYRRDKWVSVEVGFDESIDLEECEEQSAAEYLAECDELKNFEEFNYECVSQSSVDVDSIGEGAPSVIIGKDAEGNYTVKSV